MTHLSSLQEAKRRIERLESALMDALDQNGYSLTPACSDDPQWVDSARAAIDWRGSSDVDGIQSIEDVIGELSKRVYPNLLRLDVSRYDSSKPSEIQSPKYLVYSFPGSQLLGGTFQPNLTESLATAYLSLNPPHTS